MKRIGISQRVAHIPEYKERRDCLDQRWFELMLGMGMLPFPLPNISAAMASLLCDELRLEGIILSGGNSLSCCDPEAPDAAPERDAFEAALIDYAVPRSIPIVGVCRGMQMLNVHSGGRLSHIEGHSGLHHPLNVEAGWVDKLPKEVNSYHNYGIAPDQFASGLRAIAWDENGNIEAFKHESQLIYGMMWHPEREKPFLESDQELLKEWLL